MPEYDKEAAAERMKVRTKELTDKLESGMKELYNSDKYKDYLKSMSHFHNYSSKNIMLIHQQMPQATRVASFTLWKEKFDRQVKKGETGVYIYAPIKSQEPEKKMFEKLDPETGASLLDANGKVIMEELTALTDGIRFKLVPVFDIQQTHGEPLPELVENITGNVTHYNAFLDTLKAVSPLPIAFEPMNDNQDGYCRFGEKIGIRDDMSQTQTICAVVHEMTHAKLHDKQNLPENAEPKTKRVKEIESESIAYVVCQHYGIETSPNSFGYLAEYGSRDMSEIKASLDIIRKEANSLITAINDRFGIICKERGIDLTAKEPEKITEPPVQAEPSYTTESRTENIAGVDFEFQDVVPEAAEKRMTVEEKNYEKFVEMFPQVANGEYSYLRLEANGFEPLSLEWIDDNKVSIMHTYTQNGDLCYDPMMVFEVNKDAGTLNAVEYEQSIPPLYQIVDEDGRGRSIDGNGREQTLQNLQMSLNGFASQWLENIDAQEYIPVRAIAVIEGEDTQITFDNDGKPILPERGSDELNYSDSDSSRDNNGISFYTLNIDSNSVPTFYDNHMDAVDAYISAPPPSNGIDGRELGFCGENVDFYTFAQRDGVIDRIIRDDFPLSVNDERYPALMDSLNDIERWLGAAALEDVLTNSDRTENNPLTTVSQNATDNDLSDDIMPDPAIGFSEMNLYGYNQADMLPLTTDRAIDLFNQDLTVYLLFNDNTESMVYDSSEINDHDGIFGIDREEWQNSKEYKVAVEYEADTTKYGEAAVESDFIYSKEDKYAIYQIKDNFEMRRDYRFEGLDYLKEHGWEVNRNNYVLVYTAPLMQTDTLENIYQAINDIKPHDFPGHSPSVSDIIVLNKGGEITSHYIDRFGFAELPAFLGVEKQHDNVLQAENDTPAANTANIDFKAGIIGRDELETPEMPKKEAPIYKYPADYALQSGEIDAFHASRQLNIECGRAIDQAVKDNNYETNYYNLENAVKTVIDEYGIAYSCADTEILRS